MTDSTAPLIGTTSAQGVAPHSTIAEANVPSSKNVADLKVTVQTEDWQITASGSSWRYPTPPSDGGVTEILHGVEVKDPWRSLEHLETEETRQFIQEQNELSVPTLRGHSSRRKLEIAVEQCLEYERTGCPQLQGDGYYYWLYNEGSQPRDVMVRSKDLRRDFGKPPTTAEEIGPEIFFDLNKEDNLSLYAHGWSPSGRYFTAILQDSGSDWQTIRTIDTLTGELVEPELRHSKFTFGATYIGEQGFFYKAAIDKVAEDKPLTSADGHFALFFHTLRTPQKTDVIVWRGTGVGGPDRFFGLPKLCSSEPKEGSGKRTWILLDIYRNTNPETETLFFELPHDLRGIGQQLPELVKQARWTSQGYMGETHYIGTLSNDRHLFKSTDGVTPGRILALDSSAYDATLPNTNLPLYEVVAADPEGHQLHAANLVGDSILVLVYLRHACAAIVFVDARSGQPLGSTDSHGTTGDVATEVHSGEVPVPLDEIETKQTKGEVIMPKHGAVSTVSSRSDANDFYLAIDTFVAPPYVLRGDLIETKFGREVDLSGLDASKWTRQDDLICSQVFYSSHDGVKIPMFICHPVNLDLSRPQPTLLHAYGGFAHPVIPHFNPLFAGFMRNLRGVVAIACIRGGGEYGKEWHQAAVGILRHVAFEDFACATRYLHERGLTEPSLTATYGTSNGGLLVSACLVRHPELYGAVSPDVPVIDLLRFHKFTMGRIWQSEYGSPDDPKSFPAILANSPLHNVSRDPSVAYPSVLVTTADHDTRVVPSHSLKFLAELQTRKGGNKNPFFGRIYENAGHEMGSKSTAQKVEEVVDRLVFYLSALRPSSQR